MSTISIRPSRPDDAVALHRLAALDSAEPLDGAAIVAQVDGEPVAALSLRDGRVVADPFRRTAEVVTLLRIRAERLDRREGVRARVPLRARLGLATSR